MISIDTNVLLRRLLDDDKEQSVKARKLFESGAPVLITDIVLVEMVWTLKGKRYHADREDIAVVVKSLLQEPNVVFENRQAVWSALSHFMAAVPVMTGNGRKTADFADALIVSKSKLVADHCGMPYGGTFTFDQAAQMLEGTKKP